MNFTWEGQKGWKTYWVEIRGEFMDISAEYGKEPFCAIHLGVIKVKPSTDYPDKPDVLLLYDSDGLTKVKFCVFTYNTFDGLEFFKQVAAAYTAWRMAVKSNHEPKAYQCEVRPPGFFAGVVPWTVQPERIVIGKSGSSQKHYDFEEIVGVTPSLNASHPGSFRFATRKEKDETEQRCQGGLEAMKRLLGAIYWNWCIQKQNSVPAGRPEDGGGGCLSPGGSFVGARDC